MLKEGMGGEDDPKMRRRCASRAASGLMGIGQWVLVTPVCVHAHLEESGICAQQPTMMGGMEEATPAPNATSHRLFGVDETNERWGGRSSRGVDRSVSRFTGR